MTLLGQEKNRKAHASWQLNIKSEATGIIGENATTSYQQYLTGLLHNYLQQREKEQPAGYRCLN